MRHVVPGSVAFLAHLCVAVSLASASGLPLVDAVRAGDRAAVQSLLRQGADAGEPESDGSTALLWAAYRDDLEAATLLLGAGGDVNASNDLGATPVWAASQNGSLAMVRLVLEAGADPNAALLAGETPLMVASRAGFPDVAERLLAAGADVNRSASRDQTALMWAAAQRHPGVVEVLLRHGADVQAASAVWSQVMGVEPSGHPEYNRWIPHGGETALLFAARAGDLDSARILVAAGSNVDETDAWGVSATMLAAHSNFGDLVEFLLDAGADPNASAPGFTALHAAIMHRNEAMVRALVAHGADVNRRLDTWTPTRRGSDDFSFLPELVGAAPIWLAARFGTPAIMRLLVERGVDLRFVHHGAWMSRSLGDEGHTPLAAVTTTLMAAAGMGGGRAWEQPARAEREALMLEAVSLAAEAGVDVNAADVDGRTALDVVTALGFERVAFYLVTWGATPR